MLLCELSLLFLFAQFDFLKIVLNNSSINNSELLYIKIDIYTNIILCYINKVLNGKTFLHNIYSKSKQL